jgi:beta-glucanase (GH16 family)
MVGEMKLFFLSNRIFLLAVLSTMLAGNFFSRAIAAPPEGYKLAWADEFDATSLDTNKWVHWLPGRRREAINVPEAVSVTNGCAIITSYTKAGQHFTGMISTKEMFEPVHGYWEARIRFEDSPGMWSAFWLQSPTMGRPVGDPGMAGIEIDICEHRVIDKEGRNIAAKIQHTLHWDGYGRSHKSKERMTSEMKLDEGFHIYGFEWTDSAYRFYVDGQLTWTVNEAISNAKEFAILSSEIKDGDWSGHVPADGYGGLSQSKTRMVIDYVRYYAREVTAAKPIAQ